MNEQEKKIIRSIAGRLVSGGAYRGLFNLLYKPTQQTIAAVLPAMVEGDIPAQDRKAAAQILSDLLEQEQGETINQKAFRHLREQGAP